MMKPVLKLIRAAQWRWDYVTASHGAGFHAPVESARILGDTIQKGAEARVELIRILSRLGVSQPVSMPDISTKVKAQAYLGLDMKKLRDEKQVFLSTVVPEWDRKAKERQAKAGY
jgi:nitrite reductase (cytochrome c-552)